MSTTKLLAYVAVPVLLFGAVSIAWGEDPCGPGTNAFVQVVLDMDASTPGCQSTVTVPEGTTVVRDVAVYVFDPSGGRGLWAVGYLGGLDRGISFGHAPNNVDHQGSVTALTPTPGTAVHPENTPWVFAAMDKGLAGPEVHYVEFGAEQTAAIPAAPAAPIFRVDIELSGAVAGDVFRFHLADFVSIWTNGEHGAFSTAGPMTLDSGGDAVPDGTQTLYGTDADAAVPLPPAAFQVDFVDGSAGEGATIRVVADSGAVPAASTWGVAWMALLLLTGATILLRRQARRDIRDSTVAHGA